MLTKVIEQSKIDHFTKWFDRADKIVIVSHVGPDGDAIGSSLGLWHFFSSQGKTANVIVPNAFPDFLKWMPGSKDVLTVVGDTKEALLALKLALKDAAAMQPAGADASKAKEATPTKKKQLFTQDKAETKQVLVEEDGSSGATFTIGANLDPDQEKALVKFLHSNKEVFAWEPKQLAGVPREVIEHHLNVCPNVRPVRQKARRQSMEK